MQNDSTIKNISKTDLRYLMLWCAAIGLFWVVFLWGFWGKGVFAFGLNASVFLLLTFTGFNALRSLPQGSLRFFRKFTAAITLMWR